MSDSVVPLWFHFTSLFGVMLLASYLCGKRLAKTISLTDALLKAEREKTIRNVVDAINGLIDPDNREAALQRLNALIEKDTTNG